MVKPACAVYAIRRSGLSPIEVVWFLAVACSQLPKARADSAAMTQTLSKMISQHPDNAPALGGTGADWLSYGARTDHKGKMCVLMQGRGFETMSLGLSVALLDDYKILTNSHF